LMPLAINLYKSWIQEGSQFQINIEYKLRVAFAKAVQENDISKILTTIESCADEMLRIMEEPFLRFLNLIVLNQHVALSRKMALWWMQPKLPSCSEFFTFPNPVDLADSRCAYLWCMCTMILAACLDYFLHFPWMYIYVTFNYTARFFCGARISPDSWIVLTISTILVRVGVLQHYYIPSPPRRFALSIAMVSSILILVLRFIGYQTPALILCALIVVLSFMAGALNLCVACYAWNWFIKIGLIPAPLCEICNRKYHNVAQVCSPKEVTVMLSELGLLQRASDISLSSVATSVTGSPSSIDLGLNSEYLFNIDQSSKL